MFPLLFGVVLIKHKFNTLLANVSWNIGNGECINFWNDAWCGEPLTSIMNIPSHLHSHLQATLDSCIQYFNWSVPQEILAFCPTLQDKLKLVTIPKTYKEDEYGNYPMTEPFLSKMLTYFKHHLIIKTLVGPRLFGMLQYLH